MSDDRHVFPLNDLIEHATDGFDCVCGPEMTFVEREDGSIAYVVVHHSLDGREGSLIPRVSRTTKGDA